MKEEIEEFNQTNGNKNYGTRDMLKFIARKVERIEEKLDSRVKETTFWWVISVLVIGLIASAVI